MLAEEYELVIVGAGLAALSLIQRLPEALIQRTLIVDKTEGWLGGWSAACKRLGLGRLHSLPSHSPHRNASALQTYLGKKALSFHQDGNLDLTAFHDFCQKEIVDQLPAAARKVSCGAVMSVQPAADAAFTGACTVKLEGGRSVHASSVAYCSSHSIPVMPCWLLNLLADAEPHQHAPLLHESELDMEQPQQGRGIAVFAAKGHGGRAARLALRAVQAGAARVLMVLQETVAESSLPLEVGWYGAKNMQAFRSMRDPQRRLHACRQAWEQTHAPTGTAAALHVQAAQGSIAVVRLEDVHSITALPKHRSGIVLANKHASVSSTTSPPLSGSIHASSPPELHEHDCTLSSQAKAADTSALNSQHGQLGNPLADHHKKPAPSCMPDVSQSGGASQQTDVFSGLGDQTNAQPAACQLEAVSVDAIWAATGMACSALDDPVLAQLQQAAPTRIVGGYCMVDDETLVWPGVGLHLLGRCASLSLGPTAGELAGMRTAADRVAAWLGTKWRRRRLPEVMPWQACAQALGLDRGSVDPHVPLDGHGPVLLESHKASVFRPADRIDTADLPPSLPRKEVQGFTWTDSGFHLCITCPLLEPVHRNQVRVLFRARAVEMWAVGSNAAYHLYVPKLYQPVVVERCTFKANSGRQKIYLLLHKQSDADWRFLKG